MKYIGIDWGEKRVGVARSDESGTLAFPLQTLVSDARLVGEVARICAHEKAEAIVVGESRTLGGGMNPVQERIAIFAREIRAATGLPVYFEPEFFTSLHADAGGGAGTARDAAAAALILQRYLDRSGRTLPDTDQAESAE